MTGDRAKLDANLWAAVAAWVPGSAMSEATRDRYALSFKMFKRAGVLGENATVADVATVDWVALHATWKGGPSDWNHLRRALSHFLALHLLDGPRPQGRKRHAGHNHWLRTKVVSAFPRVEEPERVPDLPAKQFHMIAIGRPNTN